MTLDTLSLPLFLPADRMDRFAKACAAGADAVILDLEDAVAPETKDAARAGLTAMAGAPLPVLVRINAAGSAWFDRDLEALAALPAAAVVLPKAETATSCAAVAERTGKPVVALIETARGLRDAEAVAASCARLAFGSIDYAADLGMAHERDALLHARAALVLAARLCGQPAPLDGVTTAVRDTDLVAADARHAVALGFGGKLLIHPAQIAPARQGFAPAPAEVDWARRVLDAGRGAGAVVNLDGMMIDAPVLKRAEQIIARAREAGAGQEGRDRWQTDGSPSRS
ncbi:CoA ester lyase [Rhodobacteraceae bacterium 2CG4]|uniref:CoA ester lyase n=1 Tax=Halovulum marinum TaxID=2662447 RepID=A0A6L5Z4F3_9RHOB|nr:CoA ester lyase [Halovulum marinum]MSU90975.1 CoA ester lyase [Halovulum marinum]